MRSRSLTRIDLRFLPGPAGASSGKNLSTGSSTLSFPSATASPTAVEVKLLLREYRACGDWASYGAHHPSATTWPWHTSMTLCSESMVRSAASTNESTAAGETPCASGLLRSRSAPRPREEVMTTRATTRRAFILGPRDGERDGSLVRTGRRGRRAVSPILSQDERPVQGSV